MFPARELVEEPTPTPSLVESVYGGQQMCLLAKYVRFSHFHREISIITQEVLTMRMGRTVWPHPWNGRRHEPARPSRPHFFG